MKKFLLGAATAAHQVEGNNINSDSWAMEQMKYTDYTEPSLDALDHYNRYEEDITYLKNAGCNAYRFSIEWARIEPEEGKFDENEIQHYLNMIDFCYANGITPIVTLHHFTSPKWLIAKGGWGEESIVFYFERYASLIAERFGSKLPYVCTINEANMGFQIHKIAADIMKNQGKDGDIQVGINFDMEKLKKSMEEKGRIFGCDPRKVKCFLTPRSEQEEKLIMKAHVAARNSFRRISPNTKIGLTLSLFDYQTEPGGEELTKKLWYEDYGQYYEYIKDDDFIGVQNYTRQVVGPDGVKDTGGVRTQMGYEEYPSSIGGVVRRVAESFKKEIIVTENGLSTDDDERRCNFIREAVGSVLKAKADGINVTGYFYWSLLDNFEWQAGYSKTFGLIAVDRATQKRTPKNSLKVLREQNESIKG